MIAVAERTIWRGAEPEVPGERLGHGLHPWPPLALRPDRAIRPDVNFVHGADLAGFDLGGGFAHRIERGELIAHLRGDAHFAGNLAEPACFPDRVGKRLLAVDVLAHLHRLGRDHRMTVVGHGNHHCVDLVAELVEHLAVVGVVVLGLVGLGHAFEKIGVDVAEGEDFSVPRHVLHVAFAFAADAHAGDLHLFERRLALGRLERTSDPIAHARQRRSLQELATISLELERHHSDLLRSVTKKRPRSVTQRAREVLSA